MNLEQLTEILYEQSRLLRFGPETKGDLMLVATSWQTHFMGVPLHTFTDAMNRWQQKSGEFPTPFDIISIVEELNEERARNVVSIPDNLRDPEEQDEINRKGIADVRAALRKGKGDLNV